jgi:hypothetical protein
MVYTETGEGVYGCVNSASLLATTPRTTTYLYVGLSLRRSQTAISAHVSAQGMLQDESSIIPIEKTDKFTRHGVYAEFQISKIFLST